MVGDWGFVCATATVHGSDEQQMAHSMAKKGGFDKTAVFHGRGPKCI